MSYFKAISTKFDFWLKETALKELTRGERGGQGQPPNLKSKLRPRSCGL